MKRSRAITSLVVIALAALLAGIAAAAALGQVAHTQGKPQPPPPPPVPTPSMIAYGDGAIYTMYTNGTGLTMIAPPTSTARRGGVSTRWNSPAWSRCKIDDGYGYGYKIACAGTVVQPDGSYSVNVWVMNPDGSGKHQVTHRGSVAAGTQPPVGMHALVWSHDGSQIAFKPMAPTLVGGSALVTLTDLAGNETSLNRRGSAIGWSPDGGHLAYGYWVTPVPGGTQWGVFLAARGLDGTWPPPESDIFVPFPAPLGYAPNLAWSPDGTRLVGGVNAWHGLALLPVVDGYPAGDWTDVPATMSFLNTPIYPRWAPDSIHVVVNHSSGGIFVVNCDTGAVTQIGRGSWPDWSPDLTQ